MNDECDIHRINNVYRCNYHDLILITLENFIDKMMDSEISGKEYLKSLCQRIRDKLNVEKTN